MESSRACEVCRKRTIVADDVTGNMVCASCGVVQEYDNFQAHIGGITGVAGTYVRVGTAGSGTIHNYKESKIYHAQNVIEDFMYKLGFSGQKSQEVKHLIEKITDGEYGQGEWFPVLVGACSYVVMRMDHKMLPIVEVADIFGCDMYELGRMISRVVDFVDLKLPEFDIVNAFERAIKNCPSFGTVSGDVVKRMLQQGVFLVQCLIKWFATTGRRPIPVVAAVLVFVAELNQVNVKINDVAVELHVAKTTCRLRYKELLERLVEVAQVLPWGKDVTVKNVLKNAPRVMQYMELKSMTKCSGESQRIQYFNCDMEGLVEDCLSKEGGYGYGYDRYYMEDCSSKYFELDCLSNLASDFPDKFLISPESLTMVYSKYLEELSLVEASVGVDTVSKSKRRKMVELGAYTDWWRGKSDLSKKLILKKVLEKDVGLDARPPSFDRACVSKAKRQERIKAAKLRIWRIMHPRTAEAGHSNELCMIEPEKSRKKRKKMSVDIDWEDLIIETLLLHNVKEEEIEKGHYNALLDLHVFDHGIVE